MKALILLTALFLAGCQAPMLEYTDPNYNYLAETPTPTPSLTGYWTGMSSVSQENFKINADGTGLYCFDQGVNSSAAAIKVVNKEGAVRLMNASWYYTLTHGKKPNEKMLSSSLRFITRDFLIYRVTENDLSLHCKQQFRQH